MLPTHVDGNTSIPVGPGVDEAGSLKEQLERYCEAHKLPPESGVTEIRVHHDDGVQTRTGFFDDRRALIEAAMKEDRPGWAVYHTINRVSRSLLSRAPNRMVNSYESKEGTTKNTNIEARQWFFIDLDPGRPAGTSSTQNQLMLAELCGEQVKDWLLSRGWPEPLYARSGNGVHLRYPIDLPNTDESTAVIKRCLTAIDQYVSELQTKLSAPPNPGHEVKVDPAVSNAARIARFVGTVARKGPNTPETPHRRSVLLSLPTPGVLVLAEQLHALAAGVADEVTTAASKDTRPVGDRPPIERLLEMAVAKISKLEGRNKAGLWLFQQLRDNNYIKEEAVDVLPEWLKRANEATPGAGKYLKREAESSLKSAYENQSKRASWSNSVFRVNDQGIFAKNEEGKEIRICSRVDIPAFARTDEGDDWSVLLSFQDRDGAKKELLIPQAELYRPGREYLPTLAAAGLEIAPTADAEMLLARYLKGAKPTKRARLVDRIGWSGNAFVLPERVFGEDEDGERLVYHSTSPHHFNTSGSLEQWKQHVSAKCSGNSRLVFAASCGFAGALLEPLNRSGAGFHFRSTSSTGKSTALRVAGSVLGGGGKDGFLQSWRSTANALESLAQNHNHALLCLDEIGQCSPRDVGDAAYLLINGQGKNRMSRHLSMRPSARWNLVFLSTGEISLAEHASSQDRGRITHGGQEVRLIDIPADAGAGLGLFENLHDCGSPKEFADALGAAAIAYYGHPLHAWLPVIIDHRSAIVEEATEIIERFAKEYGAGAGPEAGRVADSFGLVAAAGELASGYGVTTWEPGEAYRAAAKCFQAWLANKGASTAGTDIEAGVRATCLFIQMHGTSRFESTEVKYAAYGSKITPRTINRAGFFEVTEGDKLEYFVFPEVFRSEVCAGFDYRAVARELQKRGFLKTEKGRLTIKHRLPEMGDTRVYAISSDLAADFRQDAQ